MEQFGIRSSEMDTDGTTLNGLPAVGNKKRVTRWIQVENYSNVTIEDVKLQGIKRGATAVVTVTLASQIAPSCRAEVNLLSLNRDIATFWLTYRANSSSQVTRKMESEENSYFRWIALAVDDKGNSGWFTRGDDHK